MLSVAKFQTQLYFKDFRFVLLAILIIVLFALNGFIYSNIYFEKNSDWQEEIGNNENLIQNSTNSLQTMSVIKQLLLKKPSALLFIAESGDKRILNAIFVNAFTLENVHSVNRSNNQLWILPSLDWSFIVGYLLSLAVIFLSFNLINGEKNDGTLKLILSNSISRTAVFSGKYIGLISIITIALLLGVLVNLITIFSLGMIPFSQISMLVLGWSILLSLLFIYLVAGLGMLVSSLIQKPTFALFTLLVSWLVLQMAIPGAARIAGTNLVTVKPKDVIELERREKDKQISENQDNLAFTYPRDPANQPEILAARMKWADDMVAVQNNYVKEHTLQKINQYKYIQSLAAISPASLLSSSLASICDTGIYGFERFFDLAQKYKDSFKNYIINSDATDSESPHVIYAFGTYFDRGAFSTKEVDPSTVPRFASLYAKSSPGENVSLPLISLGVFFSLIALALGVSLIVFARFDPR